MKVTNLTDATLDFVVGPGKDGVAETDSVGPGESKNIDLDVESAKVKGCIFAGAIEVSGANKIVKEMAAEPSAGEVQVRRRRGGRRKKQ